MRTGENTRREFLGTTGRVLAGACALPFGGAIARATVPAEARAGRAGGGPRRPTLVVVFQRGGADALNTVVPWADETYYEVRPTIAVPAEGSEQARGVIKLDDRFGLHPALAGLEPLWKRKMLAPVLGVGSPHPTRSHFDAQDFMEYGAPGDRTVRQGWLNRYLRETRGEQQSDLRGVALQPLLPRALRGDEPVLAVPRLRRESSEGLLDLFDDVYREGGGMGGMMGGGEEEASEPRDEVVGVGRSTISVLRRFWDILEKTPGPKKGVRYPRDRFGRQLETVARVIRSGAGLETCGIDIQSWDHHQGEGSTDGLIQRRLSVLGGGLAAFFEDLGPLADQVMVLVMTEFGRNVAENGNRGTDHGHGGCMLALGGPVAGGRVLGGYGRLEPRYLYQGRDLQVDVDYRQVFTETLQGLFGFEPPRDFFPRWTPGKTIGLMRS